MEKCSTIHNRCLIIFVLVTYVYEEINSVTRLNHLSFSSQNSNHHDNPPLNNNIFFPFRVKIMWHWIFARWFEPIVRHTCNCGLSTCSRRINTLLFHYSGQTYERYSNNNIIHVNNGATTSCLLSRSPVDECTCGWSDRFLQTCENSRERLDILVEAIIFRK